MKFNIWSARSSWLWPSDVLNSSVFSYSYLFHNSILYYELTFVIYIASVSCQVAKAFKDAGHDVPKTATDIQYGNEPERVRNENMKLLPLESCLKATACRCK